jgi:Holliday junction DNA helicase RuvB
MMIGQQKIQDTISILIEAAQKKQSVLPHMLFMGPSGYGKTSFALETAKRVGGNLTQINSASIKNLYSLIFLFHNINAGDVVFLDEIHRIPTASCEALYTIMEESYINVPSLTPGSNQIERLDIKPFTLIGATTSTVPAPLYNRFTHVFQFEEYTQSDICKILDIEADSLNYKITSSKIAQFARNNPRRAKNILKWVVDYSIAKNIKEPDSIIDECMSYKGIYPGGFTKDDLKYLQFLRTAPNGLIGLDTIANSINIDKKKITEEIEPFLLQQALIFKFPRGRMINRSHASIWETLL